MTPPNKPDEFGCYFDGLIHGTVVGLVIGALCGLVIGAWLAS